MAKRGAIFKSVGALRPNRNIFNLSYEKKFTGKLKKLYPILCEEMVPGDKFKISAQTVIRLTPLNAPVMDTLIVKAHYFFVPYRLLWNESTSKVGYDNGKRITDIHHCWYFAGTTNPGTSGVSSGSWTQFLNGDPLTIANNWSMTDYVLPRYLPAHETNDCVKGSLWDFFGFPTGLTFQSNQIQTNTVGFFQKTTSKAFYDFPMIFPWAAYNLIYNNFYADETFLLSSSGVYQYNNLANNKIRDVAWEKDYFTSALPYQQRGVAPALPLYGQAPVFIDNDNVYGGTNQLYARMATTPTSTFSTDHPNDSIHTLGGFTQTIQEAKILADLSSVTSADISELRLSFQVQKWLERNARAGAGRYNEFLLAHFGIAPRNETLQRPAYIGGFKAPIMVSQVLTQNETQFTSGGTTTTTPTATQRGTGIGVTTQYVGTYTATEFGLIMGLMYVTPKRSYSQGINRQWRRRTRYDFYFPEFAHLSEQGVESGEIYFTGVGKPEDLSDDCSIFGYQGVWDEMRFKPNMCCSEMRPLDGNYKYWTFGDSFASRPTLGSTFLYSSPSVAPFAVQNEDTLICDWGNVIKAYRPLPLTSEPGLIDHN